MKNENYIMLNGKKIPLTDEQIKLIQADVPEKSPFDRVKFRDSYYTIYSDYSLNRIPETETQLDDNRFNVGNYCTDKDIMKQHALHMKLNNLLWRYSMTHSGDGIDWNDVSETKFNIYYGAVTGEFGCGQYSIIKHFGVVPFTSIETAEAAIEEIVKPFIAEHPDFDLTKM